MFNPNQAPVYRPDEELTPDELAARQAARTEAQAAAQSNANLRFHPETGTMVRADEVLEDLTDHQGEQA